MPKPELGSGKRFEALSQKVGSDALAAHIGRKKYGNKRFAELGAKGRRDTKKMDKSIYKAFGLKKQVGSDVMAGGGVKKPQEVKPKPDVDMGEMANLGPSPAAGNAPVGSMSPSWRPPQPSPHGAVTTNVTDRGVNDPSSPGVSAAARQQATINQPQVTVGGGRAHRPSASANRNTPTSRSAWSSSPQSSGDTSTVPNRGQYPGRDFGGNYRESGAFTPSGNPPTESFQTNSITGQRLPEDSTGVDSRPNYGGRQRTTGSSGSAALDTALGNRELSPNESSALDESRETVPDTTEGGPSAVRRFADKFGSGAKKVGSSLAHGARAATDFALLGDIRRGMKDSWQHTDRDNPPKTVASGPPKTTTDVMNEAMNRNQPDPATGSMPVGTRIPAPNKQPADMANVSQQEMQDIYGDQPLMGVKENEDGTFNMTGATAWQDSEGGNGEEGGRREGGGMSQEDMDKIYQAIAAGRPDSGAGMNTPEGVDAREAKEAETRAKNPENTKTLGGSQVDPNTQGGNVGGRVAQRRQKIAQNKANKAARGTQKMFKMFGIHKAGIPPKPRSGSGTEGYTGPASDPSQQPGMVTVTPENYTQFGLTEAAIGSLYNTARGQGGPMHDASREGIR